MTVLDTAPSGVKTRRPDEKREREQEDRPPLAFHGALVHSHDQQNQDE